MRAMVGVLSLGVLVGCGAGASSDTADAGESTASHAEASFSYYPMGFARVNAAGSVVTGFNSTGGTITVSRSVGNYAVRFAGLGNPIGASASGGHVQVTAEGTSNVRCRSMGWGGAPDLMAYVQCNAPDGTPADSAFAVQFFRYVMPAPNPFPTRSAYSWVTASGTVHDAWDFNSSGQHNTVTKGPTGWYTVNIKNATAINTSMTVTPYGGAAGNVCSISGWIAGVATVECRDRFGALTDSAFNFSYSITGPTSDQQAGHAWFDGASAHPAYSSGRGRFECDPVSVTGWRAASLATVNVSGDLGPWDPSPFLRASFASAYGSAGYCKVESLASWGAPPMTTGSTAVRCYTPTGAVMAVPRFTLTHVTSDASAPC